MDHQYALYVKSRLWTIATSVSINTQLLKRTIHTNGKLDFGPWEQIFYGEFDGRRRKRVLVKIIGE